MLINLEKGFREKRLSAYDLSIVKYLNQIGPIAITMSVKEIAEKCFTTNSSISKLIRKLGFEDISAFRKYIFFNSISEDSLGSTKESQELIYPLIATHDLLKQNKFLKWNKMLKRNKKILIIAGTTLIPLADYFSILLNRKGFNAEFSEIQDVNIEEVKSCMVIFLSNSGVNRGLVSLHRMLEDNIDDFMAITTTNVCSIKDSMQIHLHGMGIGYIEESEYLFPIKGGLVLNLLISELIAHIE